VKSLQLRIRFSVEKLKTYERHFLKKNVRGSVEKFSISMKIKWKVRLYFSVPRRIARAREHAAALKKTESQQKRTAADRKMQLAITREEKAREAAERKARKEIERIIACEEAAREKIVK
jgi:hypothetical protein